MNFLFELKKNLKGDTFFLDLELMLPLILEKTCLSKVSYFVDDIYISARYEREI